VPDCGPGQAGPWGVSLLCLTPCLIQRPLDPYQQARRGTPKPTSLSGRIPGVKGPTKIGSGRIRLMQLVVMGVSGSGKSTVAALIARRTGCALADGDDFHSASNIARMVAGCPLDDTLRAPWLAAIAGWLTERASRSECAVVSCSALTRAYRDVLRSGGTDVRIVHLAGPRELIERRLAARRGHFMPRELLASQYATLEPLAADEPGLTIDLAGTPGKTPEKTTEQIADEIARTLPWPSALSELSVVVRHRKPRAAR